MVAAYNLDLDKVKALLADGASPNARLGFYDEHLFEDKWESALSPSGSEQWTPLLATCSSPRAPQPTKRTENTLRALEAARTQRRRIDPRLIRERDERRTAIVKELVSAKADLNLDDGHGATALAMSAGADEEIALLLIGAGADINTKERIYIDGTFDQTPLHHATAKPNVLEAMLKRNAKLDAQDSTGKTPLHWAVRRLNVASVKLLLNAGADPKVKDKSNRVPADLCGGSYADADSARRETIRKMLHEASD